MADENLIKSETIRHRLLFLNGHVTIIDLNVLWISVIIYQGKPLDMERMVGENGKILDLFR